MQGMVRTRIAPSPTGYPHIGTIYQALFDYSFAKKNNGIFFVRIEDTDRERFVEDAEEKIYQSLDWFGLTENESPRRGGKFGPYKQSERLSIYKKYSQELLEKGGGYYCFCTKERLQKLHDEQQKNHLPTMYDKYCRNLEKKEIEEKLQNHTPFVIRLKVPENTTIKTRDELRGEIDFDSNLIEDAVLIKSDEFPTYHFAVVVDDHLMQASHVLRGEEWLSSLPKHVILYDYFGFEKPLFYHTPVLRNPDKSKLSKRQGHTNVSWYIEEGFLPDAILNYLSLMGWSHPEGKEIFSLDEFIRLMELKDIKPVGPIFDIEKLKWMNGEYIRSYELEVVTSKLKEFYKEDKEVLEILNDKNSDKLITLSQSRMKTLKEFKELVLWKKVELSQEEKEIANDLSGKLKNILNWDKESILDVIRNILKEKKIKGSLIYKIITGSEYGLPLPDTLEILGKDKTLAILS